MSSDESVIFNLELNVEPLLDNARQIEGLLSRSLGYMQRLTGNEDLNNALRMVQRVTMAIRLLHSAIIAMELASGPIGWWRVGLALAGAGFTIGGIVSEVGYDAQRGR